MDDQAQHSSASPVSSSQASLPESVRKQYLDAMGIQTWYDPSIPVADVSPLQDTAPDVQPAQQPIETPAGLTDTAVNVNEPPTDVSQAALEQPGETDLQQAILSCTACELHATRSQAIPGEGNPSAKLMLIVDAPVEDRQGDVLLSSVSRNMLQAMLHAIGQSLESVYITSLVKCRPPESRAAYTSEVICCDDHLGRQIRAVQPAAILLLGETTSQQLLVSQKSLTDLRLRHHQHLGVPVFASYHPADVVNSAENKRKAWQDLLQIKKQLDSLN